MVSAVDQVNLHSTYIGYLSLAVGGFLYIVDASFQKLSIDQRATESRIVEMG